MKWHTNRLLSWSKSSIEDCANLLNHTQAAPLRVVGKDWHTILSRVCYRLKVILKVVMWSSGSFNSSYDSSCKSQNFGESGWSSTRCVNGESVQVLGHFSFHGIFKLIHLFSHTPQEVIVGLVRPLRPPWAIPPLAPFWILHFIFIPIVFNPSWRAIFFLLQSLSHILVLLCQFVYTSHESLDLQR